MVGIIGKIEPSRRTLALMYVYVGAGIAALMMVLILIGVVAFGVLGFHAEEPFDLWPWFPLAVVIMFAMKSAARVSYRRDCSQSAQ